MEVGSVIRELFTSKALIELAGFEVFKAAVLRMDQVFV